MRLFDFERLFDHRAPVWLSVLAFFAFLALGVGFVVFLIFLLAFPIGRVTLFFVVAYALYRLGKYLWDEGYILPDYDRNSNKQTLGDEND